MRLRLGVQDPQSSRFVSRCSPTPRPATRGSLSHLDREIGFFVWSGRNGTGRLLLTLWIRSPFDGVLFRQLRWRLCGAMAISLSGPRGLGTLDGRPSLLQLLAGAVEPVGAPDTVDPSPGPRARPPQPVAVAGRSGRNGRSPRRTRSPAGSGPGSRGSTTARSMTKPGGPHLAMDLNPRLASAMATCLSNSEVGLRGRSAAAPRTPWRRSAGTS